MDEPRILTDDESHRRRQEVARSAGPKTIVLCAAPDCPQAAFNSPWCIQHRPPAGPRVVADYDDNALATVKAQVEEEAAVLTVLALNWITRQQLAQLNIDANQLAHGVDRIRGELGGGDAA